MKYTYTIKGMTCGGCVTSVTDTLSTLSGIDSVEVDLTSSEAEIQMAAPLPLARLQEALTAKYQIFEKTNERFSHEQETLMTTDKPKWVQLKPLFLILAYLSAAVVLMHYKNGSVAEGMLDFMGLFYIVFSFFKFLDLKGFPESFKMYDPLAKVMPVYGSVYPFLELILGILFLMRIQIPLALVGTILILGSTTIGVTKTLLEKKKIRCACLGTALKLPMTEATFIENAIMLVMAISMLIQIYS